MGGLDGLRVTLLTASASRLGGGVATALYSHAAMLRQAGAVVDHALFVIDLPDLGGGDALRAAGIAAEARMDFPGH